MAAFCTCCGAAITLKSLTCPACGALNHGSKAQSSDAAILGALGRPSLAIPPIVSPEDSEPGAKGCWVE